jgi:hypothetical protein
MVNVGLNIGFPKPVFSRKTPVSFVRIGKIAIFANDRARKFQNNTSMKKKEYERPTTQVVQLKQQAYLLQASAQVNATMNGTWTEEDI